MPLDLVLLALVGLTVAVVLWNVSCWPSIRPALDDVTENVSVLIPARDEESTIASCVASVLSQDAAVSEVLVYDDRSSDATAAIVERIAAADPRVRLLRGEGLAAGWHGKPHACARLAEHAHGAWLLFLDADARLEPGAVAGLCRAARERAATFLSAWPRLEMDDVAERLVMPLLNVLVFSLFPAPLSLVRRDPSLGLAHGACLFVHRATYERVGGHETVRDELFEDSRLAQVWRARGEWGICLDGQHVVRVRMYRSMAAIWHGFQKNFYPAFRHEASFWAFLLLHVTIFLVPFLLLAGRVTPRAIVAVLGVLLIRALVALRFTHPLWSVLLHPAAELVLLGIALSSWWRCRTGRGVEWKGRIYRGADAGPA